MQHWIMHQNKQKSISLYLRQLRASCRNLKKHISSVKLHINSLFGKRNFVSHVGKFEVNEFWDDPYKYSFKLSLKQFIDVDDF